MLSWRSSSIPIKKPFKICAFSFFAADPRVREQIKWNAPSFLIEDHFATFKLYPPNAIQLVLHTGAKVKNHPKTFVVDDPHHLLQWVTGDRCVLNSKICGTCQGDARSGSIDRKAVDQAALRTETSSCIIKTDWKTRFLANYSKAPQCLVSICPHAEL